eukprot:6750987-Alexandrium_andersonii.AAC.1
MLRPFLGPRSSSAERPEAVAHARQLKLRALVTWTRRGADWVPSGDPGTESCLLYTSPSPRD